MPFHYPPSTGGSSGLDEAAVGALIDARLAEALAPVDTRLTALENTPTDTGESYATVPGRWQINPQAGATPGGRQVTSDTGIFSTATWVRFTTTDDNNIDMTATLLACTSIYAQEQKDSNNWVRWKVAGTATHPDGTNYIEVPVTLVNSGGSIASAQWQTGSFLFGVPVTPAAI